MTRFEAKLDRLFLSFMGIPSLDYRQVYTIRDAGDVYWDLFAALGLSLRYGIKSLELFIYSVRACGHLNFISLSLYALAFEIPLSTALHHFTSCNLSVCGQTLSYRSEPTQLLRHADTRVCFQHLFQWPVT
jgi:hypothetical protein